MSVKTFADTSDVAIAVAEANVANATEFAALTDEQRAMMYVPFQSETNTANLDSVQSSAITRNRRVQGQKNTSGNATAGFVVEMGQTAFVDLLLKAALMNEWQDLGNGNSVLVDGASRTFLYIEKRVSRTDDDGNEVYEFRRWYGNYVDEASIELTTSDLATMTVGTMAVNYDKAARAPAGTDENPGGGAGSSYSIYPDYEIIDGTNNLANLQLFGVNADGTYRELTAEFSSLTFTMANNVRQQPALGHLFAAGMGRGKFNPTVSGTAYYDDDGFEDLHFSNGRIFMITQLTTVEGSYVIVMPRLALEGPNANAGGENQDYTQDLTMNGLAGEITLASGDTLNAVMAIFKLGPDQTLADVMTPPAEPAPADPST